MHEIWSRYIKKVRKNACFSEKSHIFATSRQRSDGSCRMHIEFPWGIEPHKTLPRQEKTLACPHVVGKKSIILSFKLFLLIVAL